MKLFKVQIKNTLHIFDAPNKGAINKKVRAALRQGEVVYWPNGSKEFINDEIVFDPSKDGSDKYSWDKSGNKVKFNRVHVTITKDGKRTEKKLSPVFKRF